MKASSMKVNSGLRSMRGYLRESREGVGLVGRHHIHEGASPASILELDDAVRLGKKRIVLAPPHIDSREELCPPLAYQNGSTANGLTAESLDP
jgi:hypothetical protein